MFFACVLWLATLLGVQGRRLPDLYWNASSDVFRGERPQIVVDIMDSLLIHCPHTNRQHVSLPPALPPFTIARVTEENRNLCDLEDPLVEVVGRCTDFHNEQKIRIVFRQFTPLPSGIEYSPGVIYYFKTIFDGLPPAGKGPNGEGTQCVDDGLQLRVVVQKAPSREGQHKVRHHNGERHRHPVGMVTDEGGPTPTEQFATPNEGFAAAPSTATKQFAFRGGRLGISEETDTYDSRGIKLYEIHETDDLPDSSSQYSFTMMIVTVFGMMLIGRLV